jgi:hypothetical protein
VAFPASRNRTYTSDTPLNPADMNDLQDGGIGGWHGELPYRVDASAGIAALGTPSYNSSLWVLAANDAVDFPLPFFRVGMRIVSVTIHFKRSAGTITFSLDQRNTNDAAASSLAVDSAASGTTDTSIALDDAGGLDSGSMPQQPLSGGPPFVRIAAGATGACHVYYLDVVVDVPGA